MAAPAICATLDPCAALVLGYTAVVFRHIVGKTVKTQGKADAGPLQPGDPREVYCTSIWEQDVEACRLLPSPDAR